MSYARGQGLSTGGEHDESAAAPDNLTGRNREALLYQAHGADQATLVATVNVVLRHRRVLLALVLLGAVVAAAVSLLGARTFTASATFVTSGEGSTSAPSAAALARQFGFDIGGSRTGYSPEFYAGLAESRSVLRRVLNEPSINGDSAAPSRLIDLYAETENAAVTREGWARAEERLRRRLDVNVGQETGVVHVEVSAEDPVVAERILAVLFTVLNDFNIGVRQHRAREETAFVAERLKEAATELHGAEEALKTFHQRNRIIASPQLNVELERLGRQVMLRQQTYSLLAESLESARIEAARDLPSLILLDEPAGSARPREKRPLLAAFLGTGLAFFFGLFLIFLRDLFERGRLSEPDAASEFSRLYHAGIADLRSVIRPFRSAHTKEPEHDADL